MQRVALNRHFSTEKHGSCLSEDICRKLPLCGCVALETAEGVQLGYIGMAPSRKDALHMLGVETSAAG